VEIEDLFYNSKSPISPAEIKNTELNQVDKILVENEDLELESLEIADIDLATFGEYEAFLNKYYNNNFIDINSKIIKQIELVSGGSFATKIPFGQNARAAMENGVKLGFTFKDLYSFNNRKRPSSINLDFSFSSNDHKISSDKKWNFIHLDTILETKLYENISSQLGFGIMSAKFNNLNGMEKSAGYTLFCGINYNIKLLRNFTLTLYGRAMFEKTIDDIALYKTGSSVEQLNFGISSSMPIYLRY